MHEKAKGVAGCRIINETIVNYQHEKRLHWFEIHGEMHENGNTTINVEIDNHRDEQACAEATYKFDWAPLSKPCAFRQPFFVIRPCGSKPLDEVEERMADAMKEHRIDTTPRDTTAKTQAEPSSKPNKFRFPFGRRSS